MQKTSDVTSDKEISHNAHYTAFFVLDLALKILSAALFLLLYFDLLIYC